MIELKATSPWKESLPIKHGMCELGSRGDLQITSIAPFAKAATSVSNALKKSLQIALPKQGKSNSAAGVRLVWSGRDQYFLINATPPKLKAAITDQSDAWCVLHLSGARAIDVLARVCPLDLRAMQDGDVARSLIGHMQAVIVRKKDSFELMVFRAFAKTLVHELDGVMVSVAAQDEIPK